ncbi:CpsB/CapC family capsule biosynthesis tyrosine phosphatase, partial [Lactobacillus crispatus]|nr:exopolysaccharide biosynthesis protein [Lactobacillus crispatus]
LEFPSEDVPTYAQDTIFKIMQRGVTPIIVHPERNSRILKEPEILQGMLEQGCLVQITASSYTGIFGKKIEEMSRKLIATGQGCTFASDAHDLPRRQYQLSEAYK